jgi:hypothetical protein
LVYSALQRALEAVDHWLPAIRAEDQRRPAEQPVRLWEVGALACAAAAGLPDGDAERIADAICVHATPGVSVDRDGALGCYVQWGAMVDGAGLRVCDVSKENVRAVLEAYPRGAGFKGELAALMCAEAAAVPGGRSSLLVRCGVPFAVRMAPFDDEHTRRYPTRAAAQSLCSDPAHHEVQLRFWG